MKTTKKIKSGYPKHKHDFWFRLQGKNLFYSMNKRHFRVFGAIAVKHIKNVVANDEFSDNNPDCFKIKEKTKSKWMLCAHDVEERDNWVCKIKENLGLDIRKCKLGLLDSQGKIEYNTLIKPVIMIPLPSKTCNENYNYDMKGSDWDCECSEGKAQSPIDLPPVEKSIESPVKPLFQFDEIEPNEERNETIEKTNQQ